MSTVSDYIAITSSEMINPRRMIPKQVNRTAVRLMVLYWLSIVCMGCAPSTVLVVLMMQQAPLPQLTCLSLTKRSCAL